MHGETVTPQSGSSAALARIRESLRTGLAASGLVAGALLGMLAAELGLGTVLNWDFSIQDIVIFALLCALGSSFGRLVRRLWIADIILLTLVFLIAMTPIVSGSIARWVRADAVPSQGVDAVVVPSSAVTSSGTLTVFGSDRLLTALELIRRGVAPRLVTSRVCCGSDVTVDSDADQRRLIELAGLKERWILVENAGLSTHDETLAIDRRLRELGARSIAVVTSPLHTRRACATFERDGMRVTCIPALERGDQTRSAHSPHDRLAAFRTYVYERIGWWLYRRRGWVKVA
jgi:uncharacterized SAM-binding protein YcdF (DUF218 family)